MFEQDTAAYPKLCVLGWDDLSKDYNDIYHVLANCKPPRDSTSLLGTKRILWLCKRLRNTLYTSFVPDLFKQHISANQNNMYIEHMHIHGVSNSFTIPP